MGRHLLKMGRYLLKMGRNLLKMGRNLLKMGRNLLKMGRNLPHSFNNHIVLLVNKQQWTQKVVSLVQQKLSTYLCLKKTGKNIRLLMPVTFFLPTFQRKFHISQKL